MRFILVTGILLLSFLSSAFADASRYEKLTEVLKHLGLSDDRSFADALRPWDGAQTRQGFETILKYLDPGHELTRYLRWTDDKLSVYLDRDTRQLVDYELAFKNDGGVPTDADGIVSAIRQAARANASTQPLAGLRIALDPGHMGSRFWDLKTGKFVKTAHGYVSEGVIAFDVCLLLARELSALGADVLMTRMGLVPVTGESLDTYDLKPYAQREILASTDLGWFDELLSSAPLGPKLFANADASSRLRELRSNDKRDDYFISRVDLGARADRINAFRPHLTLVVHFDASKLDQTQDRNNAVRGYVAGNVMKGEVASRELRFDAIRTLLDGHRWLESSVFTASIVKGLSEATGVKLETAQEDYMATKVADGVYARNLALTRQVSQGLMSYVEVEYYDYTPEFRRLAIADRHAEINGIKIDYPARLDDIVSGFKKGILDYVGSMGQRSLARLQ